MKDRLQKVIEVLKNSECIYNDTDFARKIGVGKSFLSDMKNGRKDVSEQNVLRIVERFPQISAEWLLTGNGSMLKSDGPAEAGSKEHLIPLYDGVATIGGRGSEADVDTPYSQPTEYIDTGDWFRDATAAIRHYEDSMDEYPSGCILAIREVQDRSLIVFGRDYVIETTEYRVTKRVQRGKTSDSITAYSTNKETYPDGRMVHEPFDIPLAAIRRIFLVLGYVVKKNGGTMVFSSKK